MTIAKSHTGYLTLMQVSKVRTDSIILEMRELDMIYDHFNCYDSDDPCQ